jgi:ketosteroid isomerase-like protein
MYHSIVRNRVRALFGAVNRGDAEPVLRLFAHRFEHSFVGDHALGGVRTTLAATRRWYERLYRLLPDIRFELRQIQVSGSPWNTLVRWGRATKLVICPDTTELKTTLDRLALAGNVEARAVPIIG